MPVQLRPQGPVQLMRQQQAGGPVIPSPSRQGVIQHTVSYPQQQQRYPGPSPPVRAMPGSGHQWRPVHHMQQMADPMSGGAASRMIRPPGGPYNMHPAAMQQQHQQHHHQQQLLQQQQQQQQHHHQMQQQQVHGGSMMAGPVQTAPGGQPNMQTQQQQQAGLEITRVF
jgi:hypothetical protein